MPSVRNLPDIICGSIATLIGACLTYLLRKQNKYLAPIPVLMLGIGIGEVISCGVIGMIVLHALKKHQYRIFRGI